MHPSEQCDQNNNSSSEEKKGNFSLQNCLIVVTDIAFEIWLLK